MSPLALVLESSSGAAWGLLIALMMWAVGEPLQRRFLPSTHWMLSFAIGAALFFALDSLLILLGLSQQTGWINLAVTAVIIFRCQPTLPPTNKHLLQLFVPLFGILSVAHVLSPLAEWDAQEGYILFARQWLDSGSFADANIHNLYADRAQSVSVLYVWALNWGNETSCQILDCIAFISVVAWLVSALGLSRMLGLATVLLAIGPGLALTGQLTPNAWLANIGAGGCEWIQWLWLSALFAMRRSLPSAGLLWVLVAIAFLNARWNAWILLPALSLFTLFLSTEKSQTFRWLAVAFLFGCPWLVWNWHVHGNPIFPHAPEIFGGQPYNQISHEYFFEFPKESHYGVRPPKNLSELVSKSLDIGIFFILIPAIVVRWKSHRDWIVFALGTSIISLLITSQSRFQALPLLISAGLWAGWKPRSSSVANFHALTIGLFIALSWTSVSKLGQTVWSTLRDFRHGPEEMYGNRIRLWNAVRWFNNAELKGSVIWPHNPSYWCKMDVWRADQLAYSMPKATLEDAQLAADHLAQRGFRWIVRATDMYDTANEIGPSWTRYQIEWMITNDARWYRVVVLPAQGASPQVEIWRLDS